MSRALITCKNAILEYEDSDLMLKISQIKKLTFLVKITHNFISKNTFSGKFYVIKQKICKCQVLDLSYCFHSL